MGRAGRRPGLARPARPRRARSACPGRATAASPSRRRSAGSTGGYAGLFDPSAGQVEVAYYAGDFVVLHEAAHAWFNGGLLADRWANEAFASYYGLEAADELKVKASADALTPELEAARIPLNAWGAVGREDDDDRGLRLRRDPRPRPRDRRAGRRRRPARGLGRRRGQGRGVPAGRDRRRRRPRPPARRPSPRPSTGRPTGAACSTCSRSGPASSYDDLWRTWVARDTDLPLLDARRAARTEYDEVVAAAGDWQLPRPVRDAMRAWRFDEAQTMLDDATTVLDERAAIATGAAAAGLTVPDTLRTAFEGPDGFASAAVEATAELAAIDGYDRGRRGATGPPPTRIEALGLWGLNPEGDLDRARTALRRGRPRRLGRGRRRGRSRPGPAPPRPARAG